jgi:hypothetical protein
MQYLGAGYPYRSKWEPNQPADGVFAGTIWIRRTGTLDEQWSMFRREMVKALTFMEQEYVRARFADWRHEDRPVTTHEDQHRIPRRQVRRASAPLGAPPRHDPAAPAIPPVATHQSPAQGPSARAQRLRGAPTPVTP